LSLFNQAIALPYHSKVKTSKLEVTNKYEPFTLILAVLLRE